MNAGRARPKPRGGPLTQADYAQLEARWIDREAAERAELRRVPNLEGAEIVGRNGPGDYSGICIPYTWPGDPYIREYRIRRDHPEMERGKPKEKYMAPRGRGNMLYIVPGTDPAWLEDTTYPVTITEGEFKALALWRLAQRVKPGAPAPERPAWLSIAVSGAWNWRGTIGKETAPDGKRVNEKGPIADWSRLRWESRPVTIIYDRDVDTNESVRIARATLARELASRGAGVRIFQWPKDPAPAIKGVDDLLAAAGPDFVLHLIETAKKWRGPKSATVTEADPANRWRVELIRNRDGNPKALLANAVTVLKNAPEWKNVLAYNDFSMATVMRSPAPFGGQAGADWTEHEDRLTTDWLQRNEVQVGVDVAAQAIQTVAMESGRYHPVRQYLNGLKWDKTARLDSWMNLYLGVEPTDYSRAVGARWMISAVARVFEPGCKADCVLILEGPQGIYKSTVLARLGGPWFTDQLPDLGSKDASLATVGKWIIELAELDALTRPEANRIKAYMSRATEYFRPPYGRRSIEAPRQCVFAGTVNDCEYLKDATGARRFWPVLCRRILIEQITRDRDQLWAEAVAQYRAGKKWYLDSAELIEQAEEQQAARYDTDPWTSRVTDWAEDRIRGGSDSVSVPEVLEMCLGKKPEHWTQVDKNRISRLLKHAAFEKYRDRHRGMEWRYRPTAATRTASAE